MNFMLCQVESGNVTLLLTMLTGAQQSEIEAMLMNGVRPAEVANHYGKYDEFVAFLKSNIAAKLQVLLENNEITVREANELFNRISQS